MPFYRRNNGINTLGEQFAMKKNQAFQAHCEDSLAALTKGYHNRREGLQQEIKSVYREMKDIKVSTGYSLDKIRSAHPSGPFRNPNTPTVYLPPIGIRLMKKFVGLDVRTDSLSDNFRTIQTADGATIIKGKEIKTISGYVGKTMAIKKGGVVKVPKKKKTKPNSTNVNDGVTDKQHGNTIETFLKPSADSFTLVESSERSGEGTVHNVTDADNKAESYKTFGNESERLVRNEGVSENTTSKPEYDEEEGTLDRSAGLVKEYSEIIAYDPLFCLARERHFTKDSIEIRDHEEQPVSNPEEFIEIVTDPDTKLIEEVKSSNNMVGAQPTTVTIETEDGLVIERRYNIAVRRSSRSTFRTRSSIRLPSQSDSHLSDHNKEMIALSRPEKKRITPKVTRSERHEKFYLDYGDGTLHDTMTIPKIKDCARHWCKAYCTTCQRRTPGKPCFVLIPATQNYRKRLIPINKSQQLLLPMYQGVKSSTDSNPTRDEHTDNSGGSGFTEHIGEAVETVKTVKTKPESASMIEQELKQNCEDKKEVAYSREDNKHIDAILQERKEERKTKGYNRQRIDELSMPRGGPPAEVRFSKMTLRKKQNQLIEEQKMKALSDFEKKNLELIQGKISVFLALLSQQEYTSMPKQMVHLPIPIDLMQEKLDAQTKPVPIKKRVNFKVKSGPRMLH